MRDWTFACDAVSPNLRGMNSYPVSVDRPLWLLGCGNMAGAMLSRWLKTGLDPSAVTIIKPSARNVPEGISVVQAPPEGEVPAVIVLGVKPQIFATAIAGIAVPGATVISIMAGVECASIAARMPDAGAIVRMMPNLPVALGKGVSLLFADRADDVLRGVVDALATPLGLAMWMESEAMLNAGTAVSGSGPAFVYRFIDAMAAGAQKLGFAPEEARALALATAEGATALALASSDSPGVLADRVASPKGMTRAGLDVMDDQRAIYDLIDRTLKATADRGIEMAQAARNG